MLAALVLMDITPAVLETLRHARSAAPPFVGCDPRGDRPRDATIPLSTSSRMTIGWPTPPSPTACASSGRADVTRARSGSTSSFRRRRTSTRTSPCRKRGWSQGRRGLPSAARFARWGGDGALHRGAEGLPRYGVLFGLEHPVGAGCDQDPRSKWQHDTRALQNCRLPLPPFFALKLRRAREAFAPAIYFRFVYVIFIPSISLPSGPAAIHREDARRGVLPLDDGRDFITLPVMSGPSIQPLHFFVAGS